jgi:hypothetical protein
MLPMRFQFIIAMVAYAINEQLARRIEYLLEEVRVLREVYTETTGRKRIAFTYEQRRRLAIKANNPTHVGEFAKGRRRSPGVFIRKRAHSCNRYSALDLTPAFNTSHRGCGLKKSVMPDTERWRWSRADGRALTLHIVPWVSWAPDARHAGPIGMK